MFGDGILQGGANGHQAFVAFTVAVTVVVFLEEVDVDQENGKAFLLPDPIVPQQAQMVVDGAAVLQARQGVGIGKSQQRPPRSSAAFCCAFASSPLTKTW